MLSASFVRIAQVALHGKVFSEAMQHQRSYASRFADAAISGAQCKWNGTRAREDLRSIVKENLIHHAGRQGSPIHHGPAFDNQAGDFTPAKLGQYSFEIRPAVDGRGTAGKGNGAIFHEMAHRNLLHSHAARLQFTSLVLLRETTEYDQIFPRCFNHA